MAIYLNTNRPLENFKELYNEKYYVDKSEIIALINEKISSKSKYICITRPRRFGKTSIINMLGAYYTKGVNSKEIFDKFEISNSESYLENLNKYNVISISFNKLSDRGNTYSHYMEMIKTSIINDIVEQYPQINQKRYFAISDMLDATNDKFIFIIEVFIISI